MSGKTALITGANSVIGKATVALFLEAGWTVVGTAREIDSLPIEPNLHWFQMDLTNQGSVAKVASEILLAHPNLDALINNAGHILSGPFESLTEVQMRNVMEVNFFGPSGLIRAVLPHFKEQKRGVIVNVTSLCGLLGFPMFSGYHASKWALEGFSESLFHELAPLGIKVKIVEPGGVDSKEHHSKVEVSQDVPEEYHELLTKVYENNWYPSFSSPSEVGATILEATTSEDDKLRYMVGDDFNVFLRDRNYLKTPQEAVQSVIDRIQNSEKAS